MPGAAFRERAVKPGATGSVSESTTALRAHGLLGDLTAGAVSTLVMLCYAMSLGTLIFNGIANDHAPKIWAGALTACALAIAVDAAFAFAEQRLSRYRDA